MGKINNPQLDDFINEKAVNGFLSFSISLSILVLVFSLIILIFNQLDFTNTPLLSSLANSTNQHLFYILICTILLLNVSKYKDCLMHLIRVLVSILILFGILCIFSYFHILGINEWLHIACESSLFGLYNIFGFIFSIYAVFKSKFIKYVQGLNVLNFVIGFGGLLVYVNLIPIQWSHICHYLVYHMVMSLIFITYCPSEGVIKYLNLDTYGSQLARKTLVSTSVFFLFYCFILMFIKNYFILPEIYMDAILASGILIFIILLILMYSFQLSIADLNRKISENKAVKLQENLSETQNLSKIAIFDKEGNSYNWTSEIFSILEIDKPENEITEDLVFKYSLPEYKDKFNQLFRNLSNENSRLDCITKIKTEKGNIKYLKVISKYYDVSATDYTLVGFVQDITDRVNIHLELEESVENQSILLKEVHHRVKNNLQIILSLLNLEIKFNPDNPKNAIDQTRNRISAMALIHEQVYNSSDISHVNSKTYIAQEMDNLFNLYSTSNIKRVLNIDDVDIPMDKAIPLGLILNELALNTIKYAFPNNQKGTFNINFNHNSNNVSVKIFDDGVGLNDDFEVISYKSLGFTIVRNLVNQLEGEFNLIDNVEGFGIEIRFRLD